MMYVLFTFALIMSAVGVGHGTQKQNSQAIRTMHMVFSVIFFLLALFIAKGGTIQCL